MPGKRVAGLSKFVGLLLPLTMSLAAVSKVFFCWITLTSMISKVFFYWITLTAMMLSSGSSNNTGRNNLTLRLIPTQSAYSNLNSPSFPVERIDPAYYVNVRIGSGNSIKEKKLIFDTGSSLTWVQCVPCSPCISSQDELFDPSLSKSYKPVVDSSKFCKEPFVRNKLIRSCTYEISYGEDGRTRTTGDIATERFQFRDPIVTEPSLIFAPQTLLFGCSHTVHSTKNFDGIMGMGYRDESFAMQLLRYTFYDSFSYCLSETGSSTVSFGGDFEIHGGQETTLLKYGDMDNKYYLVLEDIGINGQRMGLNEDVFSRSDDGENGGCFIDSGCTYSRISNVVYDQLRIKIVDYFKMMGYDAKTNRNNLCYEVVGTDPVPPTFTYFLKGAELHIDGNSLFKSRKQGTEICWTQVRNYNDKTIIGADHQNDMRFVFNVAKKTLKFFPEVCSA